ncbi:MAG TPA: DUF6427 family protein [Chitinophagaceae bacterium]|nr:DUF6427 family protein [Chitinophagaceae bacterium]
MVGLFKRKNPGNAFLLLIYALILKFPIFLYPRLPVASPTDSYLYSKVLSFLLPFAGSSGLIFSFISFIVLFLQASLFNRIVNHHKFFPKPNFLAGMALMLVTSLIPSWSYFSAPLLVNLLMVWALYRMLNLYNTQQPGAAIFNIGILIGVCSMLYFPSIVFTLLVLFALIIMRPFRIREWIIGLLGVTTPYYFLFIFLYLAGTWNWNIITPSVRLRLPALPTSVWTTISIALLVLPFILGGFFVQNNLNKMLIQVRKGWSLLLLFLMLAASVIFMNDDSEYSNWMLTALPFAAFHASAYYFPSQRIFAAVLHWITFGYVIILMYRVIAPA